MREKVERLAKGIFEYEKPNLQLSVEKISVNLPSGSNLPGVFVVCNSAGSPVKGVVTSQNEIFEIQTTQFYGDENEIGYLLHGEYAKPGEVYQGNVTVISDCGEIKIPFRIQILPMSVSSSEGEIRDLFQLAGLAQNNFSEARDLLFSEGFEDTVLKGRVEDRTLFLQLKKSTSKDRALEEFLVKCKKKAPIRLKCDKSQLSFERNDGEVMERLNLFRDTWGYTDISVETKGSFFRVSTKRILSEDFTAGRCSIDVFINFQTLSEGNHFGAIIFRTDFETVTVPVSCRCIRGNQEEKEKRKNFVIAEGKLLQRYFDFRMGKIKSGTYLAEAESIVELLLVRLQEELFHRELQEKKCLTYELQRTYFSLVSGRSRDYSREMEQWNARYRRGELTGEFLGAYLYLEAMRQTDPEAVKNYAMKIRELSLQNKESGWLLWFFLYTEQRKEGARAYHLERIKEWYDNGGRSPFLYFEAALIFNEDASLLTELDAFEQQVLLFALEKKYLRKEVSLQCALLAVRKWQLSFPLLRCLMYSYDQFSQREVLFAICSSLISNQMSGRVYHHYFAEACAVPLRLQGIQEFFIYSGELSYEEKIDETVLMFFAYDNELEEPYRAFLYAYMVKNRDTYPALYRSYKKSMEQYTIQSLKERKINEYTAVLYEEFLNPSILDAAMADALPELCFSYRVRCSHENMKAVAVLHKEEKEETIVPLENGQAVILIYTEDASVVLISETGERYLPNENTVITKLYHGEELLSRCYDLIGENHCLLLNLLEKERNFHSVDTDVNELCKRVIRLPNLKEEFRQEEIYSLVKHCYDDYQRELLDSYLGKVELGYLEKTARCQVIELYILRGRYDLAVSALERYGTGGISSKRILLLCEKMLIKCTGELNDTLLSLCCHVFFDGQYNEEIVQYLIRFFYGTTAEMYQIWLAAAEYSLSAYELEERMLSQILFSESYLPSADQVFLKYINKKDNPLISRAYLSFHCFKYFVFDCPLQDELLPMVKREMDDGMAICKLAFLKKMAEEPSLSDKEKQFAEETMQTLAEQGKVYPFFSLFSGKAELPACMADKVYVHYHTNPEYQVKISFLKENESSDVFQTEEMRQIGYGFFVKEFILFYDEVLQYYITEVREDGSKITESFFCKMEDDRVHDETTKYGQINLILVAQELGDEKTTMDMMENYFRMEYTMNRLFSPIKE